MTDPMRSPNGDSHENICSTGASLMYPPIGRKSCSVTTGRNDFRRELEQNERWRLEISKALNGASPVGYSLRKNAGF